MARRVTQEQAIFEYISSASFHRVTQELANFEYVPTVTSRYVTQVAVMFEFSYRPLNAPLIRIQSMQRASIW